MSRILQFIMTNDTASQNPDLYMSPSNLKLKEKFNRHHKQIKRSQHVKREGNWGYLANLSLLALLFIIQHILSH